jgi:transcriptional regulator with XRE-family HTH domain
VDETSHMQIGGRIKRLRRQKKLAQADLAQALGISASYLNLIEHNRRKVTVSLLFSIAGYFGVEPGELVDSDEGRLVGDLMEAFGDDLFADSDVTNLEIRDLAHANPAAARAIVKLYDRYRLVAKSAPAPVVSGETEPFHLATDAISDFLQENANHFPALEAAAERMRADIDNSGDYFEAGLRTYLFNVFGVDVRLASLPHGIARQFEPRRYMSIGLGCSIHHAREMIYSDGMDLGGDSQLTPIGVGCRICPRLECGQRAHPPADHRFRFDEMTRPESLYARMS